jgi:glycosyltransferase involved in cell wall biosynthesis
MRIAHLTSVHDALDDRIFSRECRSLARAGYEVMIVAPGDAPAERAVDGVRIRTVPSPRNRLERMVVTGPAVVRTAMRERCEIYHLHDPELMPLGLWLRLIGKRVVYDSHEDVPKDVAQKRYIPALLRRPLAYLIAQLSRAFTRIFDATVAAVPSIADGLRGRRVVIRNYPVLDDVLAFGKRAWGERSRAAIYAGSISESRGVREMLAAMTVPEMPGDARLTLAGRFDDPSLATELAAEGGWERVEFTGWLPADALWRIMGDAKVGIVALHPTPAFVESLPVKLFDYMALGLPVVASDFPAWRSIIESAHCGILVDPTDPRDIGRAIAYLLRKPDEAETMGRNGREAVISRYAWDAEARRLLALYAELCSESTVRGLNSSVRSRRE